MMDPSGGVDSTAAVARTTGLLSAAPDTVLADPAIGERYRVVETIVPGVEDALYLARRLDTGARVELRVLTGSLGGDRVLAAALVQHATLMARVAGQCPGVAAFHECERTGNGLVLPMERPEGPTLREVIKREGTLGLNRALRLALGLAAVLERVHKLGLVHGGLRPENVVLTGPEEEIVLTHFGLDWVVLSRSPDAGSRRDSPPGDPVYRAPEQTWDQTTPGTDLYSLGVIIYEMLAGAPPPAPVPSHPRVTPEPLRNCRADVSQGLERIVMQALQVAPERRPADIAAVVNALTAELDPDRQPKPAGGKAGAGQPVGAKRLYAWGGVTVLVVLAIWFAHARLTSGVLPAPVPPSAPRSASAPVAPAEPAAAPPAPVEQAAALPAPAEPAAAPPAPAPARGPGLADRTMDAAPVTSNAAPPPAPVTRRTAPRERSADTRDAPQAQAAPSPVPSVVTPARPAGSPRATSPPATRPDDLATAPRRGPAADPSPQPSHETRDAGDDPGAIIDWLLSEGAGRER